MNDQYPELGAMLQRIRARWCASVAMRAWSRAAAGAALTLGAALLADRFFAPGPAALIGLWAAALLGSVALAGWMLAPIGTRPEDAQVARYVEERCPELEDTLATAVAHAQRGDNSPITAAVAADAARRVRTLDVDRVIAGGVLRRAAAVALAATVVFVGIGILSIHPASRAAQAFAAYAFPDRILLRVAPGDVKVRAGSSLRIVARIPGIATVIVPTLRVHDEAGSRLVVMEWGDDGFAASFDDLQSGFQYEVTAAGTKSARYGVTVVHPPRVERIDVGYEYPAAFRMAPRFEEDGGDIYGPAGTSVRLIVRTDKPVEQGALTLDDGRKVALTGDGNGQQLTGTLTIAADGSYRVALTDRDGLDNPGDTQYFIRTLEDSPPDVHIVRPAGDRPVTPIEEVPIEAKASDDHGIAALELVVSIRGGDERTVPLRRQGSGHDVTGQSILYLEDLGVRPGDFVTFYARARDISRGVPWRSSEAKSDMFFLEVKPFEEEFVSAPSGGSGAGEQGEDGSLEAAIAAQKDVITATWRLDRRHREADSRSDDDIRAVARAQAEVRRRAAGASAPNPRADVVRRRLGGQPTPQAAADSADAPLLRAIDAMEQARAQLEALSTAKALPHEMTALNELLRAQAEIRRRQVQRQEANNSSGGGSNRQGQDLSTLFDRELARQQTNYETPTTAETREQKTPDGDDALEQIRDLARRQEALNREQDDLATNRGSLSAEELRRRLERLTREQSGLRQQAEDLSQQLRSRQQKDRSGGGGGQGNQERNEGGEAGRALQQASEEMKNAASGLRRQDQGQASASGQRALDRLREGEKSAAGERNAAKAFRETGSRRGQDDRSAAFDDQRRQIGELQLESRQLADAQRRLGNDGQQQWPNDSDATRRRAGEQGRLADRMQRLEESVKQLAGGRRDRRETAKDPGRQLDEAARDLANQKLADRMRSAARAESSGQWSRREARDIARALDRLGDRLGAAAAGESAAERQSSERMARARDLREQLESVDRELSELQRNARQQATPPSGSGRDQGSPPSRSGRQGEADGRAASDRSSGRGAGQPTASSGAWERARELVDQLRRAEEIGNGAKDLEGFNPGLSAPGTEAFKQDFSKWEQLKAQVSAALERIETDAAGRLRDRQSRDRLNAGVSQAVPEQYRGMVDDYYRALAAPASVQQQGRAK